MIASVFVELGPWSWIVLGFALLAAEILVPGVFLVWIGLAALATGLLSIAFWEARFWDWQVQTLVFLALSLVAAYGGYRFVHGRQAPSDQPLLNQRAKQLVGRTATLDESIRDNRGRIRIGDTYWRVSGPDAAAGTRVRVVAVKDGDLVVEII
ncbi:NfeD family protein [Nitratireductor sp. CAU 1489]|uniref:NfeD family protein n=1 Tax=Nitratireductor arenosus TaxID=2682096 RepID=A0A844QD54_9HYPH|nr:NfeD family protein [Nitratireductor arenosus]MVA95769.1 NfeD family protein [Nitratireductor arenosus]